jgi:hypothetical protein
LSVGAPAHEVDALSRDSRRTLLRLLAAHHPDVAADLGIERPADDEP